MMKLPEIILTLQYKGTKKTELKKIDSSRTAAEVLRLFFNDGTINFSEEFVMVCLNTAAQVIGYYRVSKGGMTSTTVDVRIIATIALNCCATNVIIAHNHPSGQLKPSEADKRVTERVKEGLNTLDIKLSEHIILSDEGYFSFADEGMI